MLADFKRSATRQTPVWDHSLRHYNFAAARRLTRPWCRACGRSACATDTLGRTNRASLPGATDRRDIHGKYRHRSSRGRLLRTKGLLPPGYRPERIERSTRKETSTAFIASRSSSSVQPTSNSCRFYVFITEEEAVVPAIVTRRPSSRFLASPFASETSGAHVFVFGYDPNAVLSESFFTSLLARLTLLTADGPQSSFRLYGDIWRQCGLLIRRTAAIHLSCQSPPGTYYNTDDLFGTLPIKNGTPAANGVRDSNHAQWDQPSFHRDSDIKKNHHAQNYFEC